MNLEQHVNMGKDLKRIRNELLLIAVELSKQYRSSSKECIGIHYSIDKIDRVRSSLDSRAADELKGDFNCNIYYGGMSEP